MYSMKFPFLGWLDTNLDFEDCRSFWGMVWPSILGYFSGFVWSMKLLYWNSPKMIWRDIQVHSLRIVGHASK